MKARIRITLKNGVLDPQGKAIENALSALGIRRRRGRAAGQVHRGEARSTRRGGRARHGRAHVQGPARQHRDRELHLRARCSEAAMSEPHRPRRMLYVRCSVPCQLLSPAGFACDAADSGRPALPAPRRARSPDWAMVHVKSRAGGDEQVSGSRCSCVTAEGATTPMPAVTLEHRSGRPARRARYFRSARRAATAATRLLFDMQECMAEFADARRGR